MSKRIAVIGAGATGMTATKACLEQDFDVVVFEKTTYTGGLWRYQDKLDENGTASVMKSTIINSSKEMSAFSDFPPPAEYPNYMHNSKMVQYFDMYAARFNFTKYVRFRTEIVSVEQAADFEETGRWRVHYRDLNTSQVAEEIFDGVMICTGHHGTINQPTLKGQDKFKGTVMHTHSLKTAKGFEDKNVVVVGIGNSGGDAAVELSVVAKQVYLSTRTGSWVFQRVARNGRPFDQYVHRRFIVYLMFKLAPYWLCCWTMEQHLNSVFNHEDYQLKPRNRCFSQHPTVNDALPNRILSGTVAIKSDIDYLTEEGVVFKGESKVTPCDALIMATGYKVAFPFISETLVPVHRNKVRLYKWQFIPHIKHAHTLAFITLVQPIGALVPIGELQSRWFALLMAGKLKLPSREVMEQDICEKEAYLKRFYESDRHTLQVESVPFMDEVATEIGAFPPIWRYLITDPKLFLALVFGPSLSYQYRLSGPNSWSGARDAIMTVHDRMDAPLHTNSSKAKPSSSWTLSFRNLNVIQFIFVFTGAMLLGIVAFVSTWLVQSFV